jgi:perosamine synthetase
MNRPIPYGRQSIDEDDFRAVRDALKSDWLTTGPLVEMFEKKVADTACADLGIAVSSGTAALHAAMYAIGIGPGDEVIVPSMTFAATANAVVYQQGKPVFVDVDADTLLIDPSLIESKITFRTKAIVAVDYAGQPCEYDALRKITDKHGLALVADACHALGAEYKGRKVGSLADLNVFSFHPVKHITTGEGGMITTNSSKYERRMRLFRNHCINTDFRQRIEQGTWFYEIVDLGYNYRITDIQCALGASQLKKLPRWIRRRQEIACIYNQAFLQNESIEPLVVKPDIVHAYHLYVIRLKLQNIQKNKQQIYADLRNAGIGVNVHYIPVHLHPYYRKNFNTSEGMCPVSEKAFDEILSLPIFPDMSNADAQCVINEITGVVGGA